MLHSEERFKVRITGSTQWKEARHRDKGIIKPIKLGRKVLFPESELKDLIWKLKKE